MLAYLEDELEEAEEDGEEGQAAGGKPVFKIPPDYVLNVEMAEGNWAYCSIRGEDYSEAVSVSVVPDSGKEGDYVIQTRLG